jgi:hypothetical protein
MYGQLSPVEAKVLRFAKDRRDIQMFGQPDDGDVWDGKTSCTHTVWQFIFEFFKDKPITLNEINTKAGMPKNATSDGVNMRGMRPDEAKRLIKKLDLPYRLVFGASFKSLRAHLEKGPVMYAMRYGSAPEWRGYRYRGVKAESPFALHAGTTQLEGFNKGRHAVLLLADRQVLGGTAKEGTVTRNAGANVRAKADVASQLLGTLAVGSVVTIERTVKGGTWVIAKRPGTTWYRITAVDGTPTTDGFGVAEVFAASGQFAVKSDVVDTVVYRKDTNHGSGTRRERPAFDIIRREQAKREYLDYHDRLENVLYAAVPFESLIG